MPKRMSDNERVIALAFKAESRGEIQAIIETLKGIADGRFPVEKTTKKPRKPRTPKVTAEAPKSNGADAADAKVTSVNKKSDQPKGKTAPLQTGSEDAAWVEEPAAQG